MSLNNGTNICLTVTSEYYPISVDNTDGAPVLKRAPIENPKPYYQYDSDT